MDKYQNIIKNISVEKLKQYFIYDANTGLFTRIKKTNNKVKLGEIAGKNTKQKYIEIKIEYIKFQAHRLAWLYMTGKMPNKFIDHIDGNKHNNRFNNLREVTASQNSQNKRTAKKTNSTKFLGVGFCKKNKINPYRASITVNGKYFALGYYASASIAHNVYLNAKRKLHDACTI
jgi:hypothetical protein